MTHRKSTIIRVGREVIDVAKVNLTYDAAFTVALEDDPKVAKAILAPILQRSDFEVVSVQTHEESQSFRQRSVCFDCLAVFDDDTHCDIEMQKIKSRMPLERMLFYRAMLRAGYSLEKGEAAFKRMTPAIVVVFLDGDFLDQGKPLYRFSYHDANTHEDMEPGQGIYVANYRIRDTSTQLGRLMEDINASEPEKVYDSMLCDALEMLKSDKGVKRMTEYMEKVSEESAKAWMEEGRQQGLQQGMQQGMQQGKRELLVALYKDSMITAEESARRLNIPVEEFLKIVEENSETPS